MVNTRLRFPADSDVEFPVTTEILSNLCEQKSVAERQCLEEFEQMCQQHDWTYEMSDDHRYWVTGQEQKQVLMKTYNEFLSGALANDAKRIYGYYHNRGWGKKTTNKVSGELSNGS